MWGFYRYPVVPIVMGPSAYWNLVPPNSYIDVNDFATVRDLADYLIYLNNNEEEYLAYFKWKDKFEVHGNDLPNSYCQLCQKLNNPNEPLKIYENMWNWFLFDRNNTHHCADGKDRNYYKSFIN